MAYNMLFLQSIGFAVGGSYVEKKYLPGLIPALFEKSSVTGMPHAFSLCIGSLVLYNSWLFIYGMTVGGKRSKFKERARKDGEKDVDTRYSPPNLYVQGGTKHANAFNCAQRSHQQQLEMCGAFNIFVLASSLAFPATSAVAGFLYTFSRRVWVKGYANDDGDASKRYSGTFSRLFWKSFLGLMFLSFMTCVNLTGMFTFW